jgi:hypothetical protein
MADPDLLLEEAAESVEAAVHSLQKALFLLNYRPQSRSLQDITSYLSKVSDRFKDGKRDEGLALELVDRKWAARVMGSYLNTGKKQGLQKARETLALKRKLLRQKPPSTIATIPLPSAPHSDSPAHHAAVAGS